jgi:hypothetical protein
MLDLREPISFRELPDLIVYRDDERRAQFYALPARPRLMLDEAGMPVVKFLAYGHGSGAEFKASGGVLALTTAMEIAADEESRLRAALADSLARDQHAAADAAAQAVQLAGVSWLDGAVSVQVAGTVRMLGKPSLFGANQCALSSALDAVSAQAVFDAWSEGLPAGWITYELSVRARVAIDPRRSEVRTTQLEFAGPVNPRGEDLTRFLTKF